jgi:hypothetical protein
MRSRRLDAELSFEGACAESSSVLIYSAGSLRAVPFVLFHHSLLSFILPLRSAFLRFHHRTAGLCFLHSKHNVEMFAKTTLMSALLSAASAGKLISIHLAKRC